MGEPSYIGKDPSNRSFEARIRESYVSFLRLCLAFVECDSSSNFSTRRAALDLQYCWRVWSKEEADDSAKHRLQITGTPAFVPAVTYKVNYPFQPHWQPGRCGPDEGIPAKP